MKRTRSLHALFASLVGGCGPTIGTGNDDDAGSSDDSATTEQTTVYDSGWDDGCAEEIYVDVFEVPRSVLEPWLDEHGEIAPQDCWDACHVGGELWDDVLGCAVVGHLDDGDPGPEPPDPGTTSGFDTDVGDTGNMGDGDSSTGGLDDPDEGDTSTGDGTGDGEDSLVLLECEWTFYCLGGRGHQALQRPTARVDGDPVGRWAAAAAHEEAASVAAFMALRDELVAHGAPAELVERALEAARDEVAHARMMTRIALRRGAVPARPRFGRIEVRELETVAIENAVEGCVRETWAALEATFQGRCAAAADIRAAMRRIADDETRHAELAHDIADWARTRLDAAARRRVDAARDQAIAALLGTVERPRDATLLDEAGLPSPAVARRLAEGLRDAMWSTA